MSRNLLSPLAAAALVASLALPAFAVELDLSPEQPGRIRAEPVPEAIALIPADFPFAVPGSLTVASNPWQLPFGIYATDNATAVGAEPDIAQLVADSLGLELNLVVTAWADWPLAVTSGRVDAVVSNVTVTEERKDRYDFSTYRHDLLGFYVPPESEIQAIAGASDIAGLRIIVGSGTNQESILLSWIDENRAAGLEGTDLLYFDDEAARDLALLSGRADAYFGPNAAEAWKNSQRNDRRLVGNFSGGYPVTAEIGVTTVAGSGLAEAITAALNAQIERGVYIQVLERWGIESEALEVSQTNPPGLPRP